MGLAQVRTCDNCGHAVSVDYHRVFSVDGVLHSCRWCAVGYGDHRPETAGSPKKPNTGPRWAEPRDT